MTKVETKESVEVINTELVMPSNTNHYGTIFGGRTLWLMDMTGVLAAMQFCNEEAVTASFEAVDFKKPIKHIVEVRARVIYTSNTSMVVKIDVFTVGKFHSRKDFTCSGYATFVAIDSNGEPKPVPKLKVTNEEEEKLWEIGRQIKENTKERAKRNI
jgi:acyl-CoA hydrolase